MTRFIAIALVLIALFVALSMNHHRAGQSSSASPPQGDAFDRFAAEQKELQQKVPRYGIFDRIELLELGEAQIPALTYRRTPQVGAHRK